MTMLDELKAYYHEECIQPERFRCRFRRECSKGCTNFTEAKASLVGTRYEAGTLPRLLFLSLDPGRGLPEAGDRTFEAVRAREEVLRDFGELKVRRHWYQTHLLAAELLRPFVPEITPKGTRGCFAHVNAVKCCQNNPGKRMAESRLFERCKGYVPKELAILQPDVVVTQGGKAHQAFASCDPRVVERIDEFCSVVSLAGREVLWLRSHHPGAWKGVYEEQKESWPKWADLIAELKPAGRSSAGSDTVQDQRPKAKPLRGGAKARDSKGRTERMSANKHEPIRGLVERIRKETGATVPDVDRFGPGVEARVLIVLEAPGEQGALLTGVLSPTRNTDRTAKNLKKLMAEAGVDERCCVFWNALPWELERTPRKADRELGAKYLRELCSLLPEVRAVVAMGRAAQTCCRLAGVEAIEVWSPSGRGLAGPTRWEEAREGLSRAARLAR